MPKDENANPPTGDTANESLERLNEARETFLDALESLDPEDPNAPIEEIRISREYLAAIDPPNLAIRRLGIRIHAESIEAVTTEEAEQRLYEMIRDRGDPDRSERPYLSDLLLETVDRIEKHVTTGKPEQTWYRFVFESGESMIVTQSQYYSPEQFKRAYSDQLGTLPIAQCSAEQWENVLHWLGRDRLVVKTEDPLPESEAIA